MMIKKRAIRAPSGEKSFLQHIGEGLTAPLEIVAVLVVAYLITLILPDDLRNKMGLRPRTLSSLPGIFLHPFLHYGVRHLFYNAVALVVLGWFISLRSKVTLLTVTAAAWLVGGTLLWVVGRGDRVVGGASGIVYGYLGFIMLRGLFDKKPLSIALSLLCLYYFHGMLFGLLPDKPCVSWEGHLCGFAVGVFCAYFMSAGARRSSGPPLRP